MTPRITHIALHVAELEACAAFYREVCGLHEVHTRDGAELGGRIVWLAAPGQERSFVIVLLPGGPGHRGTGRDFSHIGLAMDSREAVDAKAEEGRRRGCLTLAPKQDDYPAGYFCVLLDPDGNAVEFSHGQPLGPGAEAADREVLGE